MPLPGGRGRAGEQGERLQRCLVGAGAAVSLIWGSGMRVQAGAATSLRLPGTTQGAGAEAESRGLQNLPQSGTRTR